MKVTFLGSGTSIGIPMPCCPCEVCHSNDAHDQRLRASVLIETGNDHLLIDCGPDFRQQMLRYNVQQLDAILLTHIHYDHTGGLDDLRPYTYDKPMPLYAEQRVVDILTQKYDYIFLHRYPGVPQVEVKTIHPEQPSFMAGNTEIIPIRLMHGKLPILGFRIHSLAYLTDCTLIPESEWHKLDGVETLVVDALRFRPHETHMNVEQALKITERLHPRTTYFTHISHQMGFHAQVEKQLPAGVHLAYDGLVINI